MPARKRRTNSPIKASGQNTTRKCLDFIESHGFQEEWTQLGLTDDDLQVLQKTILAQPTSGSVVKGTNGLRKLKFFPHSKGGARRWMRVGYVHFPDVSMVLLVVVYAKNEQDDLSAADRKTIKQASDNYPET